MKSKMARSTVSKPRLSRQQVMYTTAESLSTHTHFNTEECRALLNIYDRIDQIGKIDRLRFREILHTTLNITDDVMLDLTFHAFDRNNDGLVDQFEWVNGLSVMIRGNAEEMIEFVYYVYDMNGDRSLAREELYQCLKGCIMPGYAVDNDEIDECERDIVEIAMRKLDKDRDGQITFPDFQLAVLEDPLLIQAVGPCLPSSNAMATFLACVTDQYRDYSPVWGPFWKLQPPPGTQQKGKTPPAGAVRKSMSLMSKLSKHQVNPDDPGLGLGLGQGQGDNAHPLMSPHHDTFTSTERRPSHHNNKFSSPHSTMHAQAMVGRRDLPLF